MKFLAIEEPIATVAHHLNSTGQTNTEVENYLVAYLVVRAYSEFENRIRVLIARRCALTEDTHLKNFAQRYAKCGTEENQFEKDRSSGKIRLGDLADTLKAFGPDYCQAFRDKTENTKAHLAWDQIINNRHNIAHQSPLGLTLEELSTAYKHSLPILDAFAEALELPAEQFADLK